ncbi:hypothetical protein IT413_02630 [Candidatus Peregrinibacteria bacterium]|nr:hypothetical protein [Candidatus Peregrinibacteria bacterium]
MIFGSHFVFDSRFFSPKRFVFDKNEKPGGAEAEKKKPADSSASKTLDAPDDPENGKLAQRFKSEFANKLKGDSFSVSYKSGAIDYSYVFTVMADNTVNIVRTNESEKKEKIAGGFPAPTPTVVTVTFSRLYANKIFGMSEMDKVLAEARKAPAVAAVPAPKPDEKPAVPPAPKAKPDEKPDKKKSAKGLKHLEVGIFLPQSHVEKEHGRVSDTDSYAGEVNFRYIFTDSKKPYIAFILPVEGEFKVSSVVASTAPQVVDTVTYSLKVGAGIEVGYKIFKPFSVAVGGGVLGDASYSQFSRISTSPRVQVVDGSKVDFKPGVFFVAGGHLQLNPRWHFYLDVHGSKTFSADSHGLHILPVGGLGYSFQ